MVQHHLQFETLLLFKQMFVCFFLFSSRHLEG